MLTQIAAKYSDASKQLFTDIVQKGDLVVITKGDHMGIDGGTNGMKILTVGQVL